MKELEVSWKNGEERTLQFVFDFDSGVCDVLLVRNETLREKIFSMDIENFRAFLKDALEFVEKNDKGRR